MYGAGTVSVEFSAGSVLVRAFSIFGRNILPFLFLVAIIESPLWIYTWMAVESGSITQHYTTVVGLA